MQQAIIAISIAIYLTAQPGAAVEKDLEFFESRIRPVLVERCYSCHNSAEKREGGLALDHREGMRKGGASGAAIVPGRSDASLLVRAIRHEIDGLRMPKDGPKLDDGVVADFVRWIDGGAADPRERPPSAEDLARATSWEAIRDRRKLWWSFQPIRASAPPPARGAGDSEHPVDRFLAARRAEAGLEPAGAADGPTLIRRLSFVLTGLPPSPGEVEAFLEDAAPGAYERLADRLLGSPHFGERWARHWMDWMRYAETHGSEGDPAIPYAFRYRDYLIRALNADVPYDRMVREHIAGDLLPDPRLDPETGLDESAIAAAHYRFVEHGYAPTDALEELVRFTDNQIDVITKAFLGVTVSCARCHDHKFDPVSQKDYYALFAILADWRPAVITADGPERRRLFAAELAALKERIRGALSEAWLEASKGLAAALESAPAALPKEQRKDAERPAWQAAVDEAADSGGRHPLWPWVQLRGLAGAEFEAAWTALAEERRRGLDALARRRASSAALRWDLSRDEDFSRWYPHGNGLDAGPSSPGDFHLLPEGDRVVSNIYPGGVYTHLLSSKHSGVLTSPRFAIDDGRRRIWLRVLGGGDARARYVVEHYPRAVGPIYPSHRLDSEEPVWMSWDLDYWTGDKVHLEIATAADLPVEARPDRPRSWFGITEVFVPGEGDEPPRDEPAEFTAALFEAAGDRPPRSAGELAALYERALRVAIEAWRDGSMDDAGARFLGLFVRSGLLPNTLGELPAVAALVREYREIEARIPVPVRAPGVLAGDRRQQKVFIRGNHEQPGGAAPRRFLEAIDAAPYPATAAARLRLAEDILRRDNPLAARVIANRIWHHVFGRGLVASTDNFGRLGDEPTHPDLLDFLAVRFIEEGWSMKKLIRLLVTSEAFRLSSTPPQGASAIDPENRLLTHMPVRRLEAEAIRDALLAVSGRLDRALHGPPQGADSPRRSIYLGVRRSAPVPFLEVFDAPVPFSTTGRRGATNVPAQSLALMNDPLVIDLAGRWSAAIIGDAALADAERRIERMFRQALARAPSADEMDRARRFLADAAARQGEMRRRIAFLEEETAVKERLLGTILAAAREVVLLNRSREGAPRPRGPQPLAAWEFDGDLKDSIGALHGRPVGKPRLEDGRLVLDGESYVLTAPLSRDLREKTLEVWVALSTLDQEGGGALTVQTTDGVVFDSIVFAERQPRRWLAGSDTFQRTRDLGGAEESGEAVAGLVHIAIAYAADGAIAVYRNGAPYGEPYRSFGPVAFAAGRSQALLGMRHGTESQRTARLRGAIDRARLYDRALAADEIAASFSSDPRSVSRADILGVLVPEFRREMEEIEARIAVLRAELEEHRANGGGDDPSAPWREFAQALFNLKEFIYLK